MMEENKVHPVVALTSIFEMVRPLPIYKGSRPIQQDFFATTGLRLFEFSIKSKGIGIEDEDPS